MENYSRWKSWAYANSKLLQHQVNSCVYVIGIQLCSKRCSLCSTISLEDANESFHLLLESPVGSQLSELQLLPVNIIIL